MSLDLCEYTSFRLMNVWFRSNFISNQIKNFKIKYSKINKSIQVRTNAYFLLKNSILFCILKSKIIISFQKYLSKNIFLQTKNAP